MDLYIYKLQEEAQKRNHLFPINVQPNVVIFTFSNKDIKNLLKGVKVGISEDIRWLRCDIKSISLLPNVLEKQKHLIKGFMKFGNLGIIKLPKDQLQMLLLLTQKT